ncbi:MAG TPA: MraY family glycosyltransferase [Acidimicrobiales bacterium]|nr:MraY family glycosyltransferase [Acidimicrobiales bacterium]
MGAFAAVFAVAAVASFAFTFVMRRLSVRIGAVDQPDERRVHTTATPTLGGVAMFAAFMVAMAVASAFHQFRPVYATSAPLGVVLGAAVMLGVGVVDDLREVSPPAKLAGQVLAATVLYFLGVTLYYFRIPFAGVLVLGTDLTPLVTVLWVTVMANAVNLIDGLDGLAAGIVAIASGSFFVYAHRVADLGLLTTDNVGALVAAATCGVCIGFLPHNFHKAKIFMGDSGALMLGLLMAASTMVVGGRLPPDQASGETFFFYAPLFIPFVILGVPISDAVFAALRRAVKRSGMATADKDHLHHRLMRLGHGHRRSVVILWAWTAVLSGLVLFPTFTQTGNAVIPFGIAALGVALFTLFHPGLRQNARV